MSASQGDPRKQWRLAYNTNGFAHHRLEDVLAILSRLGYRGVALTLDVHHLDPFASSVRAVGRVRRMLEERGLTVAVETGARFILDPLRKHQPTLLSRRGWRRRHEFLERCLEVAERLGAEVVSIWSGRADREIDRRTGLARLAARCRALADVAATRGLTLGFEPEPGMFIDRLSGYRRLRSMVDHEAFGLTLDLGHLHCMGEVPIEAQLEAFAADLVHVHAEDMVHGVHEHLPFGRGEMDYRGIVRTLAAIGYRGLVAVELSRDSHRAVEAAREAITFMKRMERETRGRR